MNHPNMTSMPPVDIKDPRIRVTFADVAMRVANDGPMYGVIILVGVLALRGTTTALESIIGAAFALQARSRPPESEKSSSYANSLRGMIPIPAAVGAIAAAHLITACSQ